MTERILCPYCPLTFATELELSAHLRAYTKNRNRHLYLFEKRLSLMGSKRENGPRFIQIQPNNPQ